MPRFAANLTFLFTELPFLDRFGAAKEAGFRYVEYMFPYPYAPEVLARQLLKHGLRQVLFNLPAGNWEAGERGIAILPDRIEEFRQGVDLAMAYARALGVQQLNCLAGVLPRGLPQKEARRVLVENLAYAAQKLGEAGITLLLEPINPYDLPGFFVHTIGEALSILEEVAHPNLRLQYDVYHAQRSQGRLTETLRNHLERIGHIQIADVPGRHQPGTGEINYPFLLSELDRLGYGGYVGLEYIPKPTTQDSLAWIQEYGYSLGEE
ncbi:MAG: hydroxypyruvate isomerase [Thermus sp.]|nr:hydroxypyruvate isomerase [Thermus sp.]